MQYRPFGTTGVSISRLGFGSMRLPMTELNGQRVVDEDLAVPLLQRAFELGVNYVDSAYFYCDGHSEVAVGKALQGVARQGHLSTKFPVRRDGDYRETWSTTPQTRHRDTSTSTTSMASTVFPRT